MPKIVSRERTASLESTNPFQGVSHLRPSGDLQLREHPVQVPADRAGGQEEALADLAVGQSLGCGLGELALLRGEAIAERGRASPDRLAGGPQLLAGPPAPDGCAEGVEEGDA